MIYFNWNAGPSDFFFRRDRLNIVVRFLRFELWLLLEREWAMGFIETWNRKQDKESRP